MVEPLSWHADGAAWPHREASRFVQAGGLRWHVQVAGQGPAVWLLHGTAAASHSWRGLLPLLQARHTVVAPDLPGHGFSGALSPQQQSLSGMAQACGALAQALGLPPVAVVGHSAGAALACRATLDGHWQPQALLGVNAALLPFGGPASPLMGAVARALAGTALAPALLARRAGDARAVRRLVAATGSRLDDEGLALYAMLLRSPSHLRGALAMMGGWDLPTLWADLPRLRAPLTLLVGEADATVPPAQAAQVRQQGQGITVLRRPGLGHLAHEEGPDWVADVLQAAITHQPPLA